MASKGENMRVRHQRMYFFLPPDGQLMVQPIVYSG